MRTAWQKKTCIRPHKNINKLAEDFRTNHEITIKKEISNSIFYFLFFKSYFIIFGIILPKQKSTKLLSIIRSLLCVNLVYTLEKSKVKKEVAFLHLIRLFIACICLKTKQGFRKKKYGYRCKCLDSNFIIFCYKEFEKLVLCRPISQSEATFLCFLSQSQADT